NFQRVCGRAIDPANLRTHFNGIEDVDWERLANVNRENMTGADTLDCFRRRFRQLRIVPFESDQARTGCLSERQPKLDMWRCASKDLVKVFRGLDEVSLAENDVGPIRNFNSHRFQIHTRSAC